MQPAAARFRALAGRRCAIRGAQRLQQPQTAAPAVHHGASAASPDAFPGNSPRGRFPGNASGLAALAPWCTAQQALTRFQEIPREGDFTISPEFSVRTHDAGHILGSTWLELTITENGKKILIVFSGDIGRYDQ